MTEESKLPGRPKTYNPDFHPQDLLDKMSRGLLDCQVCADWGISKKTLWQWRQDYEEFSSAHDIGMTAWEAAWVSKGTEYMENEKDKPFKYWIAVLNNKGGWNAEKRDSGTTNITNVQVNMIDQQSPEQLNKFIHNKLDKLKDLGIFDVDFKALENDQDE